MPCLYITTNLNLDGIDTDPIISDATEAVGSIIGKPGHFVMVILKGSVVISFNGNKEPAAYAEVISMGGITKEVKKNLIVTLGSILETKLSIPKTRFFVKVFDTTTGRHYPKLDRWGKLILLACVVFYGSTMGMMRVGFMRATSDGYWVMTCRQENVTDCSPALIRWGNASAELVSAFHVMIDSNKAACILSAIVLGCSICLRPLFANWFMWRVLVGVMLVALFFLGTAIFAHMKSEFRSSHQHTTSHGLRF